MLKKTIPFTLFAPRLLSFGFAFVILLSWSAYALDDNVLSVQNNKVHIRTLAASCAACHGTQGNSHSITPVLAGLDATYFSTQMSAFKNGGRSGTVMHHHAKGLTTTEIAQLAEYFSQQERISRESPKPQTLRATHE